MRGYLLGLGLALSLLFNVFFAAGFLKARAEARRGRSPEAMVQKVTRELDLTGEQTALFSRLRSAVREDTAPVRERIALAEQELLGELDRDEPRFEVLESIMSRRADLQRQRRLRESHSFGEFVRALDPDQRARLSDRMRFRPPHVRRGRKLLERFDADGDGILDAEERAEASRHIEERRRMHERMQEERLKRFDRNGDGHLDADEREAARRSRRRPDGE